MVTVEATELVSDAVTALHPADTDCLVKKNSFSMCTQTKNHGHIKPNTVMEKVYKNRSSDT
jgi:hypothetical protein